MKKEKIFWGLFFILAGIFIIVSRLGYFPELNVFSLILTVFLVACMIKSLRHLNFAGVLFPAAFLCIIYEDLLGITEITPWPVLGAALFGSIGLSIIFHNKLHYHHFKHQEHFTEVIDQEDGNSFNFETNFGSSIKYVNSEDFTQARLECSFGAMKVYFDNAVIQNDNAVIRLDVSFAGVELYVPKTWNVINKADVSFGAIEEKNRNQSTGIPSVTLVGSSSFSGVTIIYV
jgi:predicted membrane protein